MGKPFYHMWYLYMITGVFLLVPWVNRLKKYIGEQKFSKITIIFFVMAMAGLFTSDYKIKWDPVLTFCCLSYAMIGYVIRKKYENEKGNLKASISISMGILILFLASYLRYIQEMVKIDVVLNWFSLGSPLVFLGAILIFRGVCRLDFKLNITNVSQLTFEIYLFHAGILDLLQQFITKEMDNRIVIPVMTVIVFMLSMIAAIIYKKLWNVLEKRWDFEEKMCSKIGL